MGLVTYLEAATAVLKRSREPMTVAEITEAALRKGFIHPAGRTPAASMSAALYVHLRDKPGVIRREYSPGLRRAVRNSVRWMYVG